MRSSVDLYELIPEGGTAVDIAYLGLIVLLGVLSLGLIGLCQALRGGES
jgi:hypothetical protein